MPKTIRSTSYLIATLLTILILSACGPSGEDAGDETQALTSTSSSQAADGLDPSTETPQSAGISLEITLADDAAISQYVDEEGGVLELEGPDGTLYRLELPPGSLLSQQLITLTPLTGITNLQLSGGLKAAVQILPEGLDLVLPALLTITPTTPFNPEEAVPFGYDEGSHSLYLMPAVELGESFQTYLSHFSVDGVGAGTQAEREAIASQPAASTADQYSSDTSEFLSDYYNEDGDIVPDQEAEDALTLYLMTWWLDQVRPALVASVNSPSIEVFMSAVNEYMAWQKQISITAGILGVDEENYFGAEKEEGWVLIKSAFEDIRAVTILACTEDHDLRALHVLFHLETLADILGLPSFSVEGVYDSCLQFELVFEGTVTITAETLYTASMTVKTTLDLEHPQDEDWPSVAAVGLDEHVAPTAESFHFTPELEAALKEEGCDSYITIDDGFWISMLDLNWQEIEVNGQPSDLTLALEAIGPDLTGYAGCDWPYYGVFLFPYFQLVSPGGTEAFYGYEMPVYRGWNVLGGEIYATKEFSGNVVISGTELSTSDVKMTLLHNP